MILMCTYTRVVTYLVGAICPYERLGLLHDHMQTSLFIAGAGMSQWIYP